MIKFQLTLLYLLAGLVCAKELRGNGPTIGFLNDDVFEFENSTIPIIETNTTVIETNSTVTPTPNPPPPPPPSLDPVPSKPAPKPLPSNPSRPSPPPLKPEIVYESKFYAADGHPYLRFGHKIASNDYFVAVGSAVDGPGSKVYLFEEFSDANTSTSGWRQKDILFASKTSYDGFGRAMDMSNDVLVVGAPFDGQQGFSSGAVYVYAAAVASVQDSPTQTIRAPIGQKGANFGFACSINNDTLVIGAPGYTSSTSGKGSGMAYVYAVSDSGTWLLTNQLDDNGLGSTHDAFGSAVEVTASTIAVSATGYSLNVHNGGAVYIYSFVSRTDDESSGVSSWALDTVLAPEDLTSYAQFGHTMAFTDTMGLVSAYSATGSGVVYVYERMDDASSWMLQTVLTPSDPDNDYNRFGTALLLYETPVAVSSGTSVVAVVGAPGDSTIGEMAGAIYLYTVHDSSDAADDKWQSVGKVTSNDSTAYSAYGQSLSLRSNDLFVGAELANSPVSAASGVVYVETGLISYYLTVVVDEEYVPPPPTDVEILLEAVRNALVSTVGIVLMALVPAAAIGVLIVLAVTRGWVFNSKHQYVTAAGVDAEGNPIDKDGNLIPVNAEGVAIGPGYSYFTNPLRDNSSGGDHTDGATPSSDGGQVEMQLQGVSSGQAARDVRSESVDLGVLERHMPQPRGIHTAIPSPDNTGRLIFPSPISIPHHSRLNRSMLSTPRTTPSSSSLSSSVQQAAAIAVEVEGIFTTTSSATIATATAATGEKKAPPLSARGGAAGVAQRGAVQNV